MKVIEIHSMRRSGHHAFTNWLISNLLNTNGSIGYCPYKYNYIDNKLLWVNEGEFICSRTREEILSIKPEYLFITYESFNYTENENSKSFKKTNINSLIFTQFLKNECNVTKTIEFTFIREFWNNFASLFNLYPIYSDKISLNIIQYWINYYKLLLKHNLKFNGGLFDLWIQDKEYSNSLLQKILNIDNKIEPLNTTGTNSSFKKTKLTVNDLLNRSNQFTFPNWFLDIVYNDIELTKLLQEQQLLINHERL
tara:strand:+ start:254 stop:1009 length:756 start_codon:yes stop_codon:yes gene_type:complete